MSVLSRVIQFLLSSVKRYSKAFLRPVHGYGFFQLLKIQIKTLWKAMYSLLPCVHKNRHLSISSFQGSIVVESALVFPIFFFSLFFLLQLFSMLQMELMVAEAGITAGRKTAALGYIKKQIQVGKVVEEDDLWSFLREYGSSFLENITFSAVAQDRMNEQTAKRAGTGSPVQIACQVEEEIGRAELSFEIQPVIPFLDIEKKEISVYVVYRLWSGKGESLITKEDTKIENVEKMVYMTERGSVYHKSRTCTYLMPKTESLSYIFLSEKRNSSGGKYYACDFCAEKVHCTESQIVYITQHGNRYHISAACSAIKRVIKTLSEAEAVGRYPACKKCGGSE